MELEAELIWASGPLLEENEQLTNNNRDLKSQVESLKATNKDLSTKLAHTEQRLALTMPAAAAAAVVACLALLWTWKSSSSE